MDVELAERIFKAAKDAEEANRLQRLDDLAAGRLDPDAEEDEKDDISPTPSIGHTKQVEILSKIYDLLQVLNQTTIGVNLPKGKKPPKIRPIPRPRSALEVLQIRDDEENVKDALADLGIEGL